MMQIKYSFILFLQNIASIGLKLLDASEVTPNVALHDIEVLYKTEAQVIKDLQQYVQKENERLGFLESYYNRLKTEYEKAILDIPYYLGNPINAFTLIKRLGPDLDHVEQVLKEKTEFKKQESLTYASPQDLQDAVVALSVLQDVYQLNVTRFSMGVLEAPYRENGQMYTEKTKPMSIRDLYMVSKLLANLNLQEKALPWFLETFRRFSEESCEDCQFTRANVAEDISGIYYGRRNLQKAIEWGEIRLTLEPDPNSAQVKEKREFLKKLYKVKMAPPVPMPSPTAAAEYDKKRPEEIVSEYVSELCRARIISPPGKTKSLSCFYTTPHPSFILARLKTEVLHKSPQVILYHNVLGDQEIQELKNQARRKFYKSPTPESKKLRIFSTTLGDDSILAFDISQKVSRITGLNVEESEPMKVTKYNVGKLFPLHEDKPAPPPKIKAGRRTPAHKHVEKIASFMFYLSDVELGGATVFPALNLTVFPKRGSALFWMNYLPNGERDRAVMHLGCAVLRGTKWLAVKWPRAYKKEQCPTWNTKEGPVTKENIKEVIKEHENLWKNIVHNNNKVVLVH